MNKDVIERVIERIKKNRTLYEQSEIQVRESIGEEERKMIRNQIGGLYE